MAKLWGTERAWEIVDATMQIRGGRGYETAESQAARGETPAPVERFFRDARINTIFEGSSEIMRLFIAREMLDPHLKRGAAAFNTTLPLMRRARVLAGAAAHYALWYPLRWLPWGKLRGARETLPALAGELRAINGLSRKLARATFHAMLRHGPRLDREQLVLGRLVDVATELFAWSAAVSHADRIAHDASYNAEAVEHAIHLARAQGRLSRDIVADRLRGLLRRSDPALRRVARKLTAGDGAAP